MMAEMHAGAPHSKMMISRGPFTEAEPLLSAEGFESGLRSRISIDGPAGNGGSRDLPAHWMLTQHACLRVYSLITLDLPRSSTTIDCVRSVLITWYPSLHIRCPLCFLHSPLVSLNHANSINSLSQPTNTAMLSPSSTVKEMVVFRGQVSETS